jgi:two-component system, OmpR family, KDP operon response regulator KdpE
MSDLKPTALLVEDEKQIRRFVRTALEGLGWVVHEAETLAAGLSAASTRKPDLIILDLGLPDGEGMDFLRDLRTWSEVPVIVLSARVSEEDKVQALDLGADDYLTKPFGVAELLARVRVASRHRSSKEQTPARFDFGEISLDMNLRTVMRSGVQVHLTPIEYRLLCLLATNEGKVLTHRQLLTEIWGPNRAKEGHYLRVYMGHLRQKLEQNPARPHHILTEPAVGYRLVRIPRTTT